MLCALSGGVDSSVVAVLIHRAIGDQLTCLFVDNGLLREGEAESVVATFRDAFKMNLDPVDASERFLDQLKRRDGPGDQAQAHRRRVHRGLRGGGAKLGEFPWLAQGTLYPDVIESVSFKGPSATIKTHHNVGGLPSRMQLQAGRAAARAVQGRGARGGRAPRAARRDHLAPAVSRVRVSRSACSGEVTEERLAILREADAIVQEEVRAAGLERELWQAFAVLLPVRTVGVMGDFRTYAQVIALRAVMSQDAMTADWARLPYDLLGKISTRIINEVHGREPRGLRHLLQAAEHHRVGVSSSS